jgi:CBS domain-containing protein
MELTVGSVLQTGSAEVVRVRPETQVQEALRLMAEHEARAVAVVGDGELVGVFSERNYARAGARASLRMAEAALTSLPVRELMTPCVAAAAAADPVQSWLRIMSENRMSELPIHEKGKLIALLSVEDLLGAMVGYLERVCKETELDQQIAFLRGTYSC